MVGTTTFGKGIVQSVIPLSDGSAVKTTTAKYYTPKGRCIHGTGITPDVEVELTEGLEQKTSITHEEDNQLQKAIEVVKVIEEKGIFSPCKSYETMYWLRPFGS